MWVVSWTTYNNFKNEFFTSRKREADGIGKGLSKLKHVSNVQIEKRKAQKQ